MFNDLLVVICFKILIFVAADTTCEPVANVIYEVVICFKILIFVTIDTTPTCGQKLKAEL